MEDLREEAAENTGTPTFRQRLLDGWRWSRQATAPFFLAIGRVARTWSLAAVKHLRRAWSWLVAQFVSFVQMVARFALTWSRRLLDFVVWSWQRCVDGTVLLLRGIKRVSIFLVDKGQLACRATGNAFTVSSPLLRPSRLLMLGSLLGPLWFVALCSHGGIIPPLDVSLELLICIQTIPFVAWCIYVSLIPSTIGQIRSALNGSEQHVFEGVSTEVTTRACFLAAALAGMAIVGAQISAAGKVPLLLWLSMGYLTLSFVALVLSTDVTDSAKNPPFKDTADCETLTRRGSRLYQYGLTWLICAVASSIGQIEEELGILLVVVWNGAYIACNLPTTRVRLYLGKGNVALLAVAMLVALLPLVVVVTTAKPDALVTSLVRLYLGALYLGMSFVIIRRG